ncbi:winged helix DNA-binding domain-containing protein [Streptomyces sp. NBC_00247]|uniref:DNA glycosylase AlkZ-like family protein n=1 Tax=Streptomyces sp. NBC_00247 TaxID=2975689 RepID=UPI002E282F3D|nr:crosslink repair DNA glycosylase YcaQ family protein [Streptomyces sp. NBC_00247]
MTVPQAICRFDFGNAVKKAFLTGGFKKIGIKRIQWSSLPSVRSVSREKREKWPADIESPFAGLTRGRRRARRPRTPAGLTATDDDGPHHDRTADGGVMTGKSGSPATGHSGPAIGMDRAKILARRFAAHGLDRSSGTPDLGELGVLGVQDTPAGSARLALAARGVPPDGLERVWTFRGAPHLHRADALPALAAALWPLDDADAEARIRTTAIKEGAKLGLRAFRTTAEALRTVVTGPKPKGVVSGEVSALVDPSLTFDCATCGSRHVSGLLFQQAGLFGGVRVTSGGGTTLSPLEPGFALPEAAHGTDALVRAYLHLHGPAGPAEVAKYLGVRTPVVRAVWPEGLLEVEVTGEGGGGRTAWLAGPDTGPPEPGPGTTVRLLPPGDPFLQGRDRELLVPDEGRRKEVWRAIGGAGVLLVGAEPAGTWRAKAAGRAVAITVAPFAPLTAPVRRALEAEAGVVAAARGADEARLHLV